MITLGIISVAVGLMLLVIGDGFIGQGLTAVGAGGGYLLARWQGENPARAIRYIVRLRTASGELRVYESNDAEHIHRIVDAVSRAIAA